MTAKKHPPEDALRVGYVLLRTTPEGLEIEHTGKLGHVVTVLIDPSALQRWALRQLREQAFA